MSNQDWALAALENPKPRKPLPVVPIVVPVPVVAADKLAAVTLWDELTAAVTLLKANGYRVTRILRQDETDESRPAKPSGLNAIGKPYSAMFDPKYRMKYKTSRRVACTGTSTAASNNAQSIYRAAMERKHSGNAALLADVLTRQIGRVS